METLDKIDLFKISALNGRTSIQTLRYSDKNCAGNFFSVLTIFPDILLWTVQCISFKQTIFNQSLRKCLVILSQRNKTVLVLVFKRPEKVLAKTVQPVVFTAYVADC